MGGRADIEGALEQDRSGWLKRFHIAPALALVRRSHASATAASLAITVLQGLLPVALLYTTKRVVDAVASAGTAQSRDAAFHHAMVWIAAAALCVFLMAVAGLVGSLLRDLTAQAVTDHVFDSIHGKTIEMQYGFFEDPHAQDILHRAQREAPFRPTSVVQGIGQVVQSAISLVGVGFLLLAFHWSLTLLLAAAAIPSLWIRFRYSEALFAWQREQTASERKSLYYSWLLTTELHAKEVRTFELGEHFCRQFQEIRARLRRDRARMATGRTKAEAQAQVVSLVPLVAVLMLIGFQAVNGLLTVGTMVMFYQAFMRGQAGVRDLADGIAHLYDDGLFLTCLDELLALEAVPHHERAPSSVPVQFSSSIKLDHVGFGYPTGTRRVLNDVTMTVHRGEKIALVGHNGCGKTTLVKLLLRLFDPTDGTILVDGVDTRCMPESEVRRLFSVVFQDYGCYNLSARENIGFGDVQARADDERINRAASLSGADRFLCGLPRGYDTTLGKWFTDGEQLSIGQWQKVALARALMRDAPIVLLDEPTSAMDPAAEYAFFQRLLDSASEKTIILISHRLSTVRMVDRIYFMENGRIIESGTHDELVRRDGAYAQMFVALGERDA